MYKKTYTLIIMSLFILSCIDKHDLSDFYPTVHDITSNFNSYLNSDVDMVGYLIRLNKGQRNQDYLLLNMEDHAKITKRVVKIHLGILLSSQKAEDGYEIDNKCVNTWVEVSGIVGYSKYSVYRGHLAINDYPDLNGKQMPVRIAALESENGSYECKWIKKRK